MLDSSAGPRAWLGVPGMSLFLDQGDMSDILFEEGRSVNNHVVDYMAIEHGAIYCVMNCTYTAVHCKDFTSSSSYIFKRYTAQY